MSALRVRWATGPDDKPGPGEAVARMRRVDGRRESYPGAGRVAPRLTVDLETGEATAFTPADGPSDLVLNRSRFALTVTAGDGRELVARFDLQADAPLIPEDAPADLRHALRRAWRVRGEPGSPGGGGLDFAGIVAAIVKGWTKVDPPLASKVAEALGCSERWLSEVAATGGGYGAAKEAARRAKGLPPAD